MWKELRTYQREKKIYCGTTSKPEYMEVDIFPITESQRRGSTQKRRKKENISAPKQKNLNDKRAKRYLGQLCNANFGEGDMVIHLTYSDEHLPKSIEEAEANVIRYLRRLAYRRKKKGLPPLKYVFVTQEGRKANGTHRYHHHILINGGLSRDEVEEMWWKEKENKRQKKKAVLYGWANADRLRPNKQGISQLAAYMAQDYAGKRHWKQSQNLDKPWSRNNDHRYSGRKLKKLAQMPEDSEDYKKFWESQYEGYELVGHERVYNDFTGWSFYLKLRKRD